MTISILCFYLIDIVIILSLYSFSYKQHSVPVF